ncbi:extracellular catalytic domain type 1 short-chain-length polyhydroxyalkanoate depolymerase [Dactylosporangium sp. CA-139066]|uniref:extracellular catalytic domain type 1 short-chain-length polyhydroxyalkanoate depolymerase n=1 Tax=Dactylosporangium sp. CA-139066 TaxID=3239930 RepID=UPI003D9017D1
MPRKLRALLLAAALPLVVAAVLVSTRPASAAGLTRVTGFGNNPTNLNMYIYVPATVAPKPALLVLVHYCGGSASGIFNGNGHDYATAADRYGYIIVVPEATRSGNCFDVSTPAALKRNGGSDSTGIMSMVAYARAHYPIDASRIVVSGFSSGAMMTNVLAAEYPDVFSAASAYSGVPAGCFATTDGSLWNSQCSGGNVIHTAQQWGDLARAMYPGYTGRYPRMQLWHGTTDTTLAYPNFGEEIKQWTNLNSLSQTPAFTDHPQSSWTRTRYGNTGTNATVEGISIAGVGHQLPMSGQLAYAIAFLGLDGSGGTTSPTPSASASSASPPPAGTTQLVGVASGRCLDVPGGNTANGTQPIIWDCHGATNQQWTVSGGTVKALGKCLDSPTNATAGVKAQLWDCTGAANQQWSLNADGTIRNAQSGLCLDVNGAATANGSTVILWTCTAAANQRWNRV